MRVLIVEDEEELCKHLHQELRNEGYEVDYTTSPVGVLEKLRDAKKKGHAYELLLLDLRMPKIDGLTLLKAIREALSDLDVIIITGYGDENNAIESIRLGAIDYLRKPISLDELRTAIFRVQQKRAAEEKKALEWSILVVDDEKDLCEHIKRELDKEGYQVAVAYDGAEGLDYFKNNRADVVLADIKMPRLSGLEMLEKCRAITDDFVAIIITGHGDYEKAIEALKSGVFDYLKKPISLDELIFSVTKGIDLLTLRRSLSARKRELELERALKELELHLQQLKNLEMILGLAADGISIVDRDFNIILVNETFAKMSGISKTDAVGKKCYEVFSGELCHTGRCSLTQILKGHAYLEEESKMESADGTKIPCLFVAKPYKSLDGELVGVMEDFRDITERKKTEDDLKNAYHELRETHVQLLQAGKLAAMGEMAAGVVHELTQPLLGIKGFATALLVDAKRQQSNAECGMRNAEVESEIPVPKSEFPPRAVNDLEVILQQTNRMTTIVNMVRDFARAAGTEMKLLDVNKPLEDALMLFSEQLRLHHIVVEENLAQDLPQVIGNANQLQQVFINLITNARDAMDAKGGEGRLKISTRKSTEGIYIEIEDTGIGADAETVSRMFAPFFTTKTEGKGMGLGLSIVDRIIMEHGGKIDVQCAPGEGCKFSISLPFGVDETEGDGARGETAKGG
jgi:two-component system NtrC family sensor kinase